jgi:hypothetical protein
MRYDLPTIMEQELQYMNRELEYLEQSPIEKMSGSLAFVKHKGDIENAHRIRWQTNVIQIRIDSLRNFERQV